MEDIWNIRVRDTPVVSIVKGIGEILIVFQLGISVIAAQGKTVAESFFRCPPVVTRTAKPNPPGRQAPNRNWGLCGGLGCLLPWIGPAHKSLGWSAAVLPQVISGICNITGGEQPILAKLALHEQVPCCHCGQIILRGEHTTKRYRKRVGGAGAGNGAAANRAGTGSRCQRFATDSEN